ncbi:MAG TPA: hypothetical protein VGS22_25630 [Thermoanaerobaculia bacterium]|nr:hypothetical protein [Thermoanaerobaculia bacterium]
MSLEGPDPSNSLTVVVTIVKASRVFTPQPTRSKSLSWNVDHRRLDIAEPGRYFLILAAQDFTLDSPAIEFKGRHHGISVYEADTTQVTILIATDATAGERAEFWLIEKGGGTVDPTILVDPPGLIDRPAFLNSEFQEE